MRQRLAGAAIATIGLVGTVACSDPSVEVRSARLEAPPPSRVIAPPTPTTLGAPPPPATDGAAPTTVPLRASSPAAEPTTTVTVPPTTEPPAARRVTLAFSGDILPHSPLWRGASRNASDGATSDGSQGYDFTPMLAALAPLHHRADLAICHLETPIAPAGEGYSTMPRYGVPAEVVDAIVVGGFGRCSTASNHTLDRGSDGIDRTVEVLTAAGVSQAGMARTPDEIEPTVLDVAGVAVAHLSYTWSYNGLRLPDGDEWRSALIDPERILADVDTARAEGAETVVVSLHWGTEKSHRVDRYQREIAEALTAAGTIDLLVGHHAHVLQPIEQVNGTWVLFGLGNLLSNHPTSSNWPAASQDAAVVVVEFVVGPDGDVTVDRPRAYPTWVDIDAGWVVRIVAEELARTDLSAGQRGRLERSLARTVAVLGDHVVGAEPVE